MEKNSEFIRNKEFHIVFKGYKPEEVDKFLDIMSVEFDRLAKRNRELQESLDRLKFESTAEQEESDIKKIIQDALVSAHKVAEDIKNQAKKEAEELIGNRQLEEEKSLEKFKSRKLKLEESIIVLQSRYDEFKGKIRKTAEDINRLVEEADYIYTVEDDTAEETETGDDSDAGQVFEDSLSGEGLPGEVKTAPEESPEAFTEKAELEEKKQEEIQEEKPEEKPGNKSREYFSNFENFRVSQGSQSGYYFDKQPEEKNGTEKQSRKSHSEEKSSDARHGEKSDDSPKRERKKIDIANPDIIENFFKASDD